jgi:hypothetical protein
MACLFRVVVEALGSAFAQITDFSVELRAVGEAPEEVGRPACRVGAASLAKAKNLAEGAGPQAGRYGGGGESGWGVHAIIRS